MAITTPQTTPPPYVPNCGECMMNHATVVPLTVEGICPNCGADYSAVLLLAKNPNAPKPESHQ